MSRTNVYTVDNVLEEPDCSHADLTVQFGWLSADQQAEFEENMGGVENFIAAAVRTNYNKFTLRGKGFIYLKPDSGPLSTQVEGFVPNPWSLGVGHLIDYTLRHELGHVFGIPHKGMATVMAVDFLERAHSTEFAEGYAIHLDDHGFFTWNRDDGSEIRTICADEIRAGWSEFIGASENDQCYRVKFNNQGIDILAGTAQVAVGGNLKPREDWRKLGHITLKPELTWMWEEAVRIYLPLEQNVITDIPDGAGVHRWIVGPMIKNEELSGTYRSEDGAIESEVFLTLAPNAVGFASSRFSVNLGNGWIWNLDWVR